jgi:hypothetical protein
MVNIVVTNNITIKHKTSTFHLQIIISLVQFLLAIILTTIIIIAIKSQKQENQKKASIIYLSLGITTLAIFLIIALIIFGILGIVIVLVIHIIPIIIYTFYGIAISRLNKGSIYIEVSEINNNEDVQK